MVNSSTNGININQSFQAGPELYNNVFPEELAISRYKYLQSKGYLLARAPLKSVGSRQIDIDWQRKACALAKKYFPSLSFGSGIGHPHKPEDWDTFINFLVNDEVPWILAQVDENGNRLFGSNDIHMLSNEAEGYCSNVPVVSVTRTSNVVTVVYGQKHMMETGDGIVCQFDSLNISSNQFGAERVITKVDDYTFTFASTGSNGSASNPSVATNYFRFHARTVYRIVKRISVILKAIPGYDLKTSYSILQGVTQDNESNSAARDVYTNVYYIDHAATVGLGSSLDYFDLNVYSYTSTQYNKGQNYFKAQIDKGYTAFGSSHFRVTEWNLWNDANQYYQDSPMACKNIAERLSYLETKSGLQHFFFCYDWQNTTFLQLVNPYNKSVEDGAVHRDWWWVLIGERAETVEVVNNNPVPVIDVREIPAIVRSSRINFNMGQYEQSGVFNSGNVSNNLDFLRKAGVPSLRIASGDPSFPAGVTACRNLALAAKDQGFYVIFANSGGGATDANWDSTIVPQAIDFADWAATHGIDEINEFNELDYRQTVNAVLTNSVQKQMDVYSTIHGLYPNLVVSTALAQSSLEYVGAAGGWIERAAEVNALGLKIMYNVYGDNGNFDQFKQRIIDLQAAYSDLRISEWSLNSNWSGFPQPESEQTSQIKERLAFLGSRGLDHYFFTFNWDQSNDQFALKKADGTYREWYGAFFDIRDRERVDGRELTSDREVI